MRYYFPLREKKWKSGSKSVSSLLPLWICFLALAGLFLLVLALR